MIADLYGYAHNASVALRGYIGLLFATRGPVVVNVLESNASELSFDS